MDVALRKTSNMRDVATCGDQEREPQKVEGGERGLGTGGRRTFGELVPEVVTAR